MTNVFTLTIGVETYEFKPYNYQEIELQFSPDDKAGAWQYLYSINDIEIGGIGNSADYQWLYSRLMADKCNMCYLTYTCNGINYEFKFNYWQCEFDLDNCIIAIKANRYLPNYENFSKWFEWDYDITESVVNRTVNVFWLGYVYDRAKKLHDILDYICGSIGCSWTSTFLTNPFPPIQYNPGDFDHPYETLGLFDINVFSNLHISQSLSSTDAIELSISTILDALCNQHLNLRWRFNEDINTLQIEHYKYFENSLSYNNPPVVGFDATIIDAGKWLKETNNYKVNDSGYYSQERWYMPIKQSDVTQSFEGSGLTAYGFHHRFFYDCAVMTDKINKINALFETNVHACERIGDNQLLLMAVDDSQYIYEWLDGAEYVVNYPFQNGIIYKWWMWNRPYPLGRRDLINPEFSMESTIKSRSHEIEVPTCCTEINPYQLVKTNLGNGYIDNYSFNISTGITKFTLKYEDL